MRGRAWSTLLVMALAVAAAAAAQEFLPPLPPLGLKVPFLAGTAVYYAMRREPAWGAAAAFWCGVAEDGLSGVPGGVSALALLGAWLALWRRARPQMVEGTATCAVCGAAVAPALALAQYAALRLGGGLAPLPAWFLAARFAASVPAGAAAAGLAAAALRALDWLSANVGREEEEDDALGAGI